MWMNGDNEEESGTPNESVKNYVKIMEYNLKLIQESKPEDRLQFAKDLMTCLQVMKISLKGWEAWLSSYSIVDRITLAEFQELYPKMKQLVIDFVELDLKTTQKKLGEEDKKSKPAKKSYIS